MKNDFEPYQYDPTDAFYNNFSSFPPIAPVSQTGFPVNNVHNTQSAFNVVHSNSPFSNTQSAFQPPGMSSSNFHVIFYQTIETLTTFINTAFENIQGQVQNAGNQHFLLFQQCF